MVDSKPTIADLLIKSARTNPAATLLAGTASLTYEELLQRATGVAGLLGVRYGVERTDRVAVMFPRGLAYLIAYFGVSLAGAVIVPVATDVPLPEAVRDLNACDAGIVLCQASLLSRLLAVQGGLTSVTCLVALDDDGRVAAEHRRSPQGGAPLDPWTRDRLKEAAILLHTSGTIASPKRVMLSHEGLVVNQWAHAQSVGLRSSDRALVTLPLYFGYCNTAQILAHLALGGFLVLAPYSHFAPVAFCRLIEEHGVTVTTVVPAMLEMLVGLRNLRRFDLSSLRMICFGGSGLSEDRQAVVQAALPHVELVQTYGQTEAGPRVTTLRGPDAAGRPGSAGFPIAGVTVDVVDDAGLPLPTGLAGEVRVRSPGTMLGYYRQPEKTAEVLTANGLLTGDLGRLDADGFLYLVGRRRNLILTGGINVYPEEVESYLEESPGVAEALVYGQAHPILGEVPVAEVVPRRPVSAEEILLHARKGLALHKVPRAVRLVKALAKTPSGKKVRPRAREEQS